MKVSFNGLRKRIARSYNCIVRVLNTGANEIGDIEINIRDIRQEMEDLKISIGTLLCCYGDEHGIDDISGEIKLLDLAPKENG